MKELLSSITPTGWLFFITAFVTATLITIYLLRREQLSGMRRIMAGLFYFVISFLLSLGMLNMSV